MKRVALYCRVSTVEQHVENQLIQLRDLSAKRGYQIVGEYIDRISGVKSRRPGLDALMIDSRRGKHDLVFVSGFDRIARSVRDLLQILDELESLGVEFASAREAIDTSGPMGRLFLTVIGAISALERDILKDRVRQGIARRRLMGLPVGRQPRQDIDRETIVTDRLGGMSLTTVAKRHSVSRASVVRWVREAKQSNPALSTSYQPVHEYREEVAA
jgi:DNA invertase Pin-like site-specific DNA recombinase